MPLVLVHALVRELEQHIDAALDIGALGQKPFGDLAERGDAPGKPRHMRGALEAFQAFGARGDLLIDPLEDRDDRLAWAVRKDDEEFVAADAADGVGAAHGRDQGRACPANVLVASGVAEGVVDQLEPIQVGQADRERRARAPALADLLVEDDEGRAAIDGPGQGIRRGEVPKLGLGALETDEVGDDSGEDRKGLALLGAVAAAAQEVVDGQLAQELVSVPEGRQELVPWPTGCPSLSRQVAASSTRVRRPS